MMKLKIILQGEDGVTNHTTARITIDPSKNDTIADKRLLRWNGKIYCFVRSCLEGAEFVAFFNECDEPYDITEF